MSRKLQFRALLGLVAVISILVGVLVWPAPKEAKAEDSVFGTWIDWNGFDPDDLGILPYVTTRVNPAGPNLDHILMSYQFTNQNGMSYWKVHFTPNTTAVYWEVEIDNLIPHDWLDNPISDGDDVVFNGNNELDNWFICVDD